MRNTVLKKFIFAYIIIFAIAFFCVAIVVYNIDYQKVINETTDNMYNQAVSISNTYSMDYFFGKSSLSNLTLQLKTVAAYNNTVIMMLNTRGEVIINTNEDTPSQETVTIEDFDPARTGTRRYIISTFHDYFDEDYITVIAPITYNMGIRGYVLIHKSVSSVKSGITNIFNTNYITMLICMFLSAFFIVIAYYVIHKPISEITLAVKEFGHGNLGYKIKKYDDDEIGRLAAALTYMSAKLNELEESQKKFIANVSHDFRSPLTSIKGYLEAILDGTIPHEMQDKYLNIVIFETERLSKLTNNLLTLNNIDSQKNRLNLETFDINVVIKRVIETFDGTCKNKGISFDLTFSDKSVMVTADLERISQVLYNLVDNAIKFSHNNSYIYINESERGEKVFISIKDTGIGIPKDSVDKIWERFYKSDLSRGKDKKGTGLGLSIVKEIINAHQENIDVISTEGAGTEFIFSLQKYTEK